jgi:diguanylate cyclase (GGDEF)-like protein
MSPSNNDLHDEDHVADLVGWARGASLRSADAETSRQILATALGIDTASLASMPAGDVEQALDRLRGLVEHCDMLASAAEIDDLTGTMRRGAGLAALRREVDRTRRHRNALSILFVDVDRLKEVNDRDGHSAGDELLVGVVRAIRDRLRSYDLVIRWGGDEFVCGLAGADRESATRLAADIRTAVSGSTTSTVTIGIATMEKDEALDAVIGRADHDLYQRRSAPSAVR